MTNSPSESSFEDLSLFDFVICWALSGLVFLPTAILLGLVPESSQNLLILLSYPLVLLFTVIPYSLSALLFFACKFKSLKTLLLTVACSFFAYSALLFLLLIWSINESVDHRNIMKTLAVLSGCCLLTVLVIATSRD